MEFAEKPKTSSFLDLEGHQYHRWTVLGYAGKMPSNNATSWWCRCDCGTERRVAVGSLRSGASKCCGCRPYRPVTHGRSTHREYQIWNAMIQRCRNPNNSSWDNYGGRGITVCDAWLSFDNFLADMGSPPSPEHQIDRIDNDLGYHPDNCQWATREENCSNTRNNIHVTHDGTTKTIAQWARQHGIPKSTLSARLRRGMPFAQAINNGKNFHFRLVTYSGKTQSITEWAREVGIKPKTLWYRIRSGWDAQKALFTPVQPTGR